MPLVKINMSKNVDGKQKSEIAKKLSKIICEITGKPEAYTMALVESDASIVFAGKETEGAFVEVKGIGGLSPETNKKLSSAICTLIQNEIGIKSDYIYLNFTDVPATNWGWKGRTFA